ncbi:hypothetical protein [Yoonia sp. SS1-5]|uniref:Uncharacterized protein n=1 Tax=Yoonia rhodophyticola TaxID=3137370 RepID=A0AAN0M859_9RHOB
MMLPRWFGDESSLEVEARKAALRTANETGAAAHFTFYETAFKTWDLNVPNIDIAAFKQGSYDLITLRANDPAFVAQLYQRMIWWANEADLTSCPKSQQELASTIGRQIDDLRKDILQTRLTAIHGHSWQDGVRGAIDAISSLAQDHIRAGGATFALT